jgi:putative nucleotidyltransferase with HDIG domain
MAKVARRERPSQSWGRKVLENLRSQLTWLDALVGFAAATTISFLLVGFRYQSIPEYDVGAIAAQDVRAYRELTYTDVQATAQKREEAAAAAPAVYELDTAQIVSREAQIATAFSRAREILASHQAPPKGVAIPATKQKEIRARIEEELGAVFPPNVLPLLIEQRFDPDLTAQMLKVLDRVLRAGIVSNRAQFLKDQRIGIVLRDSSSPGGRPLTETFMVRDLAAARDYLRQFQLEFSALLPSASARATIIGFLETVLVPTIYYQEKETVAQRQAAAAAVAPVEVQIKQGKTIVRSGEEVTRVEAAQLEALRNLRRPYSLLRQLAGFFLFSAILIYALWRYFVHYQSRHKEIRGHEVLILLIVIGVLVVMRLMTALSDILSERVAFDALRDPVNLYYAIPFAFGTVLVALLVDTNLGIFTALIVATLAGLFYGEVNLSGYILLGSLAGIYSVRQYKDRAAILKAGLTIGVMNALALLGLDLVRQSPVTLASAGSNLLFAFINGILASALASMLLPALESLFKITTDIRLLELSNLNAPVLRRLSVEAPGTYHHSLMVGTLAEAAAEAVGANPLLVRVGAYYHDLGKMLKPEYFVENQMFGMNKHEALSPSMSCLIIASHVKDGLELAKEIGLAPKIRDLIPQHHGTRIMTYFYQKAKESLDAKHQEIDEADYRYPGPKPQSKEAAIMMMADSVEAASRTLTNPTPAQIQGMINRLVDAILNDNQFDECDITLRDIRLVKETFFKILTGIYHRRIDYPGYDFRETAEDVEKISISSPGHKPATAL